jgi:hypothetical protein
MKKFLFCLGALACISCQPTRPEQTNFHLYHDARPGASDELVTALSERAKLRTDAASFNLDNQVGDDLYVYNIILSNFTIYIQKDTNIYNNGKEHIFINIARWKSGGNIPLKMWMIMCNVLQSY